MAGSVTQGGADANKMSADAAAHGGYHQSSLHWWHRA